MLKLRNEKFYIKLADIAYCADDYENAIELWNQSLKRSEEYFYAKLQITDYPARIVYYEKANNAYREKEGKSWATGVYEDFRRDKELINDSRYGKYIINALLLIGDKIDLDKYLPNILANVTSDKDYLRVLDVFKTLDKDVISSLMAVKLNMLNMWDSPVANNPQSGLLFDMIAFVKSISNDKYFDTFTKAIKDAAENQATTRYFKNNYPKKYDLLEPINYVVFVEWGRLMEKRQIFIDAILYYEWAKKTIGNNYKIEMDKRWIVCKNRQGNNDNNSSYLQEAADKQRELGISDDLLTDEPQITYNQWISIFKKALEIDNKSSIILPHNSEDIVSNNIDTTILEEKPEDVEKKKSIEQAKKMKSKGYPFEDISEFTGLSIEEIEKL